MSDILDGKAEQAESYLRLIGNMATAVSGSNWTLAAAERKPADLPLSLTEYAADRLRQAIVDGSLELGQQISESALASSFGISKTPIREALVRLQREGMVIIHPRRGTFVFTPTKEELAEICDCRTILETAALKLAMEANPAKLTQTLDAIEAKMRAAWESSDTIAYRRLDTRFHLAFFEHCDNRYLCEAYQLIAGKMAALRTRLSASKDHVRKSYDEHLKMIKLLKRGDVESTLQILEGHIGRRQGSYWMSAETIIAV